MNNCNSYQDLTSINYTNYYYNHPEESRASQSCLEEIKQDYLKKESVKLVIPAKTVESVFSKDIIDKWISLLKTTFKMQFVYEQNQDEHIIKLKYSDFNSITELYICLVLVRYLWYRQNNFLIYRILHILENSSLTLFQSIKLAHFYDYVDRDSTFNIFQSLVIPMDLSWVDFKQYIKYSEKIHQTINNITYSNIKIVNLIRNLIKFKPLSEDYEKVNYEIKHLYSQLNNNINDELTELEIVLKYFKYSYTSITKIESFSQIKQDDVIISLYYSRIFKITDPDYNGIYALSYDILNNSSQDTVYKGSKKNIYVLK